MKKKHECFYVGELVVEITRRCNLRCAHCLRGDSEPTDIPARVSSRLAALLRDQCVGTLVLGGGEPSLFPLGILRLVAHLRAHNVDVQNYFIVTNGVQVTEMFLRAVFELHLFCSDNEISGIDVSNTKWHEAARADMRWGAKTLELLKTTRYRQRTEQGDLLWQGRAKSNGLADVSREPNSGAIEIECWDGDGVPRIFGAVYINVLGEVIDGCDWSYAEQAQHRVARLTDRADSLLDLVETNLHCERR